MNARETNQNMKNPTNYCSVSRVLYCLRVLYASGTGAVKVGIRQVVIARSYRAEH